MPSAVCIVGGMDLSSETADFRGDLAAGVSSSGSRLNGVVLFRIYHRRGEPLEQRPRGRSRTDSF